MYSSLNIVVVVKSRRMKFEGHIARMRRGEVFTEFLLGGPKKRPHTWRWREDNIKLDLIEIGLDGSNWIQLAQYSVR
jgi:hypothetical protein